MRVVTEVAGHGNTVTFGRNVCWLVIYEHQIAVHRAFDMIRRVKASPVPPLLAGEDPEVLMDVMESGLASGVLGASGAPQDQSILSGSEVPEKFMGARSQRTTGKSINERAVYVEHAPSVHRCAAVH